ncbi:hypothetical protein FEM03_07555 [Phragmitibacter flavus]|uniref:Uncharacterized protein n=1 Tax=Phragmitibacter flavus TaxID=2576071 RepID=A0A5R8KGE8_9BACT|nr:hypothetical protein [Phragmitibacter flavus]TLD71378.1 hypothetical protein FEM03_07555 [Phragmitibacter flavus]
MNSTPHNQPGENSPRPRLTWIISGALLIIVGVLFMLTIALSAIGIVMMIGGGALIVAAFISRGGRQIRNEAEHREEQGGS